MRIAVAVTADFAKVSGHAGRARHWLVFTPGEGEPQRVELAPKMVFHHFEGDTPHPLDGITALIAAFAGESLLKRLHGQGVETAMTAESDPAKAVDDYLAQHLAAPRPRPIGALVCKAVDLLTKHK